MRISTGSRVGEYARLALSSCSALKGRSRSARCIVAAFAVKHPAQGFLITADILHSYNHAAILDAVVVGGRALLAHAVLGQRFVGCATDRPGNCANPDCFGHRSGSNPARRRPSRRPARRRTIASARRPALFGYPTQGVDIDLRSLRARDQELAVNDHGRHAGDIHVPRLSLLGQHAGFEVRVI